MQKKAVRVGDCVLDGKHIYIQSMLNTRSDDIAGSVAQAKALEVARKMKARGLEDGMISEMTGLPPEEIKKL